MSTKYYVWVEDEKTGKIRGMQSFESREAQMSYSFSLHLSAANETIYYGRENTKNGCMDEHLEDALSRLERLQA